MRSRGSLRPRSCSRRSRGSSRSTSAGDAGGGGTDGVSRGEMDLFGGAEFVFVRGEEGDGCRRSWDSDELKLVPTLGGAEFMCNASEMRATDGSGVAGGAEFA